MKVVFLGHSGFLLEWDTCYWLFDYYIGSIPQMNAGKKLICFVSHSHPDHFNPKVLDLPLQHPNVEYVLSHDVRLPDSILIADFSSPVVHVKPNEEYRLDDGSGNPILVDVLESTDLGVAFLIDYMGRTVYHAGDLNLWVWEGEPAEDKDKMSAAFFEQMKRLEGRSIELAFAPLDPRQDNCYHLGLDALVSTARIKHLFPMHFGKEFSVISRYNQHRAAHGGLHGVALMDIQREGQTWDLDSGI